MIKNKRADISGEKILFYITSIIALGAIIIAIMSLLFTARVAKANIPEGLENYLIIQRFSNSPYCFSYEDPDTGRYLTRTIDWSRFTEDNFQRCYNAENKNIKGFRLKIINTESGEESTKIKTKNWKDKTREELKKKIRIHKDGKIYYGKLIVEIQNAE